MSIAATTLSLLSTCVVAATAAMAMLPISPQTARAADVEIEAGLGQSVLVAGKGDHVYLKIGLNGVKAHGDERRLPVNIGLVIDRSGSMEDDNKIGKAREAAQMALSRLDKNDIGSVVAFNHEVDVLLPATRITNKEQIDRAIGKLVADGNTALYAGTKQGIEEVAKFIAKDKVNRVILISDGLANVGPSEPEEVAALGRKAAAKGITISTIGLGLGYNEDLMSKLAYSSDGDHVFVERSEDLAGIFDKEFGNVLSVVAQELVIKIHCDHGFKPIRAIGREADISGSDVTVRLNQLYGGQQKYVVIELSPPSDASLGERSVANVELSYSGKASASLTKLDVPVKARFSADVAEADRSVDSSIMSDVTIQLGNEKNERAVELRDAGNIEEAKKVMQENAADMKAAASRLNAPALAAAAESASSDAAKLDDEQNWSKTRKVLRAKQFKDKSQQAF